MASLLLLQSEFLSDPLYSLSLALFLVPKLSLKGIRSDYDYVVGIITLHAFLLENIHLYYLLSLCMNKPQNYLCYYILLCSSFILIITCLSVRARNYIWPSSLLLLKVHFNSILKITKFKNVIGLNIFLDSFWRYTHDKNELLRNFSNSLIIG